MFRDLIEAAMDVWGHNANSLATACDLAPPSVYTFLGGSSITHKKLEKIFEELGIECEVRVNLGDYLDDLEIDLELAEEEYNETKNEAWDVHADERWDEHVEQAWNSFVEENWPCEGWSEDEFDDWHNAHYADWEKDEYAALMAEEYGDWSNDYDADHWQIFKENAVEDIREKERDRLSSLGVVFTDVV